MRTFCLMSLLTCLLLLCLAIGAPPAMSAPIPYRIDFSTQNGIAPSWGSFKFDALTATFTNFTVQWDSLSFDFTSIANDPGSMPSLGGCLDGATGALAVFYAFTQCPGGGILGAWSAQVQGPDYGFFFNAGGDVSFIGVDVTPPADWPSADNANGWYSVTAVPEPGSSTLTLIGIGLVMRKQIAAGLRRAIRTKRSLLARR